MAKRTNYDEATKAAVMAGSIEQFRPQRANRNKHKERGMGALESSMRKLGYVAPMTACASGEIIDGSARLETSAIVFDDDVLVVHHDGTKPVIMVRDDIADADTPEARQIAIAANRIAALNLEWDVEGLLADAASGLDLSGMFSQGELDEMLAELTPATSGADTEPQVDKAEELRQKFGVETGQIWQLGPHRLACGDCADRAVVERLMGGEKAQLMVTDPPYGVEYDPAWRNDAAEKGLISYAARSIGKVENDDRADWSDAYRNIDAPVAYVWHAGRRASEVQASLESVGYQIISQIIWAKPVFAISRGDYHWQHEPCWYAVRKGNKHNWQGSRSESTLWEIERGIPEKTGHGTEKPIECMAKPIRNNTAVGDLVVDPFLGSGTTLIAAHNLNRRCFGVEISPAYCGVILERFSQHTGIEPVLAEA